MSNEIEIDSSKQQHAKKVKRKFVFRFYLSFYKKEKIILKTFF